MIGDRHVPAMPGTGKMSPTEAGSCRRARSRRGIQRSRSNSDMPCMRANTVCAVCSAVLSIW